MSGLILVIEDEPAIADNITYALKTEGFEPVWQATGEEGLAVLNEKSVQLVVLDVGLPDINGFELCKRIRQISSVPVIFLTARDDEVDRVVGLEIGGDDYMVKPFSPRELTARIKAVLRRSSDRKSRENEETGDDAPFHVDEEKRHISYFGSPLELSKYEYKLLLTFIQHPGRVFSRETLMNRVWEEPDCSLDRTVDAHIKNIRNKLKAVNADYDPIETRRGFGYCLREAE